MALQKPANKIVLNGEILLDLTADTVVASKVFNGVSFHNAKGEGDTGTMLATATTAQAGHVLNGYTFYDNNGELITGDMLPVDSNGEGYYKVTENADGSFSYEFIADDISTATVELSWAASNTEEQYYATIAYVNDAGNLVVTEQLHSETNTDAENFPVLTVRKNTVVVVKSTTWLSNKPDGAIEFEKETGDGVFVCAFKITDDTIISME